MTNRNQKCTVIPKKLTRSCPAWASSITFRSATRHELKDLMGLIREYYAFDHIPFDEVEMASGLPVLIRTPSLARAWLIRAGTSTVGYVIISFWFDLEFGGRAAAITDLYLGREHRRKGFGRKAIAFVEAFCRKEGISALELQVEKRNRAARAFYKAAGFMPHDRIPMSKRLRSS